MPESAPREKASPTRSQRRSAPERGERAGHERPIGNRSMGALLTLGAPSDAAEARADAAADGVMQRLAGHPTAAPMITARPASGTIRRAGGAGQAMVSPQQSSRLAAAKRGGRPIAGAARGELERGFGRSLSSMRIHDGPEAHGLARAFGARAFCVDNHVFFGAGQYQPHTKHGKRLLSHEIAHGLEGEAGVVRRLTYNSHLDKYYSDALKGQKVDDSNGVASVVGSASSWHGGHAFIYLEYLDKDKTSGALTPRTRKLELTAGGGTTSGTRSGSGSKSGSGNTTAELSGYSAGYSSGPSGSDSGSTERLVISIGEANKDDIGKLSTAGRKKSWVVQRSQMDGILAKAHDIKANVKDYTYKLVGRSLFATKKTINCVRFAEKILKAGGIKASAGKAFKLASTLTSGGDVGHEVDQDWLDDTTRREEAARREAEAERAREAAAELLRQQQAQQAELNRTRIEQGVPVGKVVAVWNPTATTINAQASLTDPTMVPYTFVTGEPRGPLETQAGTRFVISGIERKAGTGRMVASCRDRDGEGHGQLTVDLIDLLDKTTSLTPG